MNLQNKTLQQLHESLQNAYEQRHWASIADGKMGTDFWDSHIESIRREIEERKGANINDLFS